MSFGYRILGFGSGAGKNTYNVQYLVVAGGGGGGGANMGGSGGAVYAEGVTFSPTGGPANNGDYSIPIPTLKCCIMV